jgi:hypothetical protein
MKDPLGQKVLQDALNARDRFEAMAKALYFEKRQLEVQSRDLLRFLTALTREVIAEREAARLRVAEPGQPVEAVVLSMAKLAEEGDDPVLNVRLDRDAATLTLRVTPFPDAEGVSPNALPAEGVSGVAKDATSRIVLLPGTRVQ